MTKQIISLSDNAAARIKEIMSKAEKDLVGLRVGVKSGGCAGMSYIMEYTKEVKPNDEVIEDKGVKKVDLDLVWDPPWDKSMMSESAKLELNL